ncbi:hypothetical protein [Streptomyces albicerus]|uniref:hypothetical protein n=1 Tax=Streptomyces albicerus TaxID=2569859 RepID=UPI00124AEFAD|nr:hypothetical protein [Streptomyces albicerus]
MAAESTAHAHCLPWRKAGRSGGGGFVPGEASEEGIHYGVESVANARKKTRGGDKQGSARARPGLGQSPADGLFSTHAEQFHLRRPMSCGCREGLS